MIGWRDYITLPALAARLPEGLRTIESPEILDESKGSSIRYGFYLPPRSAQTPPLVEAAEAVHREALKMAHEMGMWPLIARCHQGLGLLYRRMGKRKKAREHLTTTMAMYSDMDIPYWRKRAEMEMSSPGEAGSPAAAS